MSASRSKRCLRFRLCRPGLSRRPAGLLGGFTLIELVVALALGAMLMAALVGVLRSVDRQLSEVKREATQDWQRPVLEVLHRDLMLSSEISSSDGWIWLDGSLPTYRRRPSLARRVGYRCVSWIDDSETVLLRLADDHGEPLAIGPRRVLIERLDGSDTPQPLSAMPAAMPDRVRVWIWDGELDEPMLTRDLVLR